MPIALWLVAVLAVIGTVGETTRVDFCVEFPSRCSG